MFRIADKAIKDHGNRDKKNGFPGPAFVLAEVMNFLKSKLPTPYGVVIHDTTPDSVHDAMEQGLTHSVPDPSIPTK